MIDWLTIVVPCTHLEPIRDGCLQRVGAGGEVEWSSDKRLEIKGSFDSAIHIRTAAWLGDCTHIEVSGNFVKFFQGHNLWGTDDLPSLAFAFLYWLAENHGQTAQPLISPNADDITAWKSGDIQITRADIAESFHLANQGEVLAWLRSAEQTAHLAHRGRGQLVKGSTLYFGQHSRRWSIKLYAKGQEIQAKGHGQDTILSLPSAVEWAGRTLRAELVLRSMELKRLGLSHVRDWLPVDGVPFGSAELLRDRLGDMTMTTTARLSAEAMESLRPALRLAVQSWESGSDLRATLPRPTFYKYRKELLAHGIDIATLVPREGTSNVVPLHRVLEAVPATVPDWAIGTPLYFEPRRVA